MNPWQWAMRGLELIKVVRYSCDQCTCGHPWSSHYQPRPGGHAACWETPKGVLCNCHRFVLVTDPRPESVFPIFSKE
ncbi:hypothetical protein GJ25_gp047 [Mycobacterium phage Hawkeye]|uniref:Uncharacterized protein n=1 Tax=Mycobacterium phage Hawkeye TaxID=1458711 RepID=X2KRH9_9CAUD|nr:hypothetical protein GJ25_gp047 [Mycobacterium phage Hawkeye]AHN84058.1 hypothetical protein PBI_HAWKEYE_47 [Mycobacterium phage Hawkeye]